MEGKKSGNKTFVLVTVIIILVVGLYALYFVRSIVSTEEETIKVGVLHSLTGTMAISEKSVVDATLLAVEEINSAGGILGKKIEPIIADGKSDWPTFAYEAEDLITRERVKVVFGCWTSASRKTVKPVFERYDHLLFYPVQYEGLEESQNIVYTGAAPNQQVIPGVEWAYNELDARKFFLIGSDYVFPRSANEIMKLKIKKLGGEIVGEDYLLLGSKDFDEVVEKIKQTKPDVVLNTINGDSNLFFFKELRSAEITPEMIPVISFSIAEDELRVLESEEMLGDYAVWNYFQSVDSYENKKFVTKFKERYGENRVTDDPIEAGYFGVYLWKNAVEKAGTTNVDRVKKVLEGISFNAPGGIVTIDANQHTWKKVRVGKIKEAGQFEIVWESQSSLKPEPYPQSKPKSEWIEFLYDLYTGWDENWSAS